MSILKNLFGSSSGKIDNSNISDEEIINLAHNKLYDALSTGIYLCPICNNLMEFENENKDVLICTVCNNDVLLDDYGYAHFGYTEEDLFYESCEDLNDSIPEGCSACGGPYPLCKDGCNIFDD
jgi:hypothetical protein